MIELTFVILKWTFIIGLIVILSSFAILLSEAKDKQTSWSSPIWLVSILIGVFSIFAGIPAFTLIDHFIEIPKGPWNLGLMIILGVITKNIILSIMRKKMPEHLTRTALKHFT